jgi:hypothetical protein
MLGLLSLLAIEALGILFYQHQVSDNFYFRSIGYQIEQQNSTALLPVPTHSRYAAYSLDSLPGFEIILAMIVRSTGLNPADIQFLPFGILILPLFVFCIVRRISGSTVIGLILAMYMALQAAESPTLGGTFVHMWGYSIFMVAVMLFLVDENRITPRLTVSIVILFVGAHFLYYITELWLLVLLVAAASWRWARRPSSPRWTPLVPLAIALAVLFFGFNQLVYNTFVPAATTSAESNITFLMFRYLGRWFGGTSPDQVQWAGSQSGLYTIINGILIIVLAGSFLPRLIRSMRQPAPDVAATTTVGIGFTVAADFSLYPLLGPSLQLRTLFHLVPLVNYDRLSRLAVVSASILITLSVLSLGLVLRSGVVYYPSTYETTQPGAQWLMDHADSHPPILSDFRTIGFLTVLASERNWSSQEVYFTSSNYRWLVSLDNGSAVPEGTLVIINVVQADRPTASTGWIYYAPLSSYKSAILDNNQLDPIYDDGQLLVLSVGDLL